MSRFGPSYRYPTTPITPHGGHSLLKGRVPHVTLRSYDNSIVFNLMGPLSIPDRTQPERVEVTGIKGLTAPWKTIDQKGATQDGISFVDALYDPIEIELDVTCVGRDPAHLRQVVSHLVAALDVKQEAELSWFTPEMGRWFTKVRWLRPDAQTAVTGIKNKTQKMVLRLRADTGFWQNYPSVDSFQFDYSSDVDDFDYTTADGDDITGWNLAYTGAGTGHLYTDGDQAITSFSGVKTVVAQRSGYVCSRDNMVVGIEIGTSANGWPTPDTYIDIWARMNNSGTPGLDGIRCRIGIWTLKISRFVNGVETVLREYQPFVWWWGYWAIPINPMPGEKWAFIVGTESDPRTYQVMRNGAVMLTVVEGGTDSLVDSSHRRAGFGVASISATNRAEGVRKWTVGSSATTAQSGYLELFNVGDQPAWPRFTCIGPGTFYIGNGPGSTEFVKFGPLLPNQIMQIRTDPRKRGVVDLSAVPLSQQKYAEWAKARDDYYSFLSVGALPPNDSAFGVLPPQGNPYQLMSGRFSVPIPARSPAAPTYSSHIACRIDNGNANSQIIGICTPYRRLPY